MSNVIKAMNIRYTQEKRTLDLNERADGFQRLYVENLAKVQEVLSPEEIENEETVESTDPADILASTEFEALEAGHEVEIAEKNLAKFAEKQLSETEINALISEERDNMLENIKLESEKLLAATHEECDRIINETRAELEVERAGLYDNAKAEGYKDGLLKAKNETDALKQELEEKLANVDLDFEKKVDELEPAFVELTISLIQKITGILVDDRRDLILHIIRQSILNIENSNKYIIHVSKDDFDFVNSKRQELSVELKGNTVEVVEDAILTRAQCTIETDTRIFDCSLDVQLKNLISDLKLLSGQ